MQPTNHTGKEFTDEQWDDLLSKTFGPPVPTPSTPGVGKYKKRRSCQLHPRSIRCIKKTSVLNSLSNAVRTLAMVAGTGFEPAASGLQGDSKPFIQCFIVLFNAFCSLMPSLRHSSYLHFPHVTHLAVTCCMVKNMSRRRILHFCWENFRIIVFAQNLHCCK